MAESGGGASRTTDPASGSSAATDVSLLDHVASWRLDDRRMNDYRDSVERRFRIEMIAALLAFGMFAWKEILRRLEILNHENERLLTQQEKTVSQDTYAANEEQRKKEAEELGVWRKEVDKRGTQAITRDEFQRDTKTDKRAGISTTTTIIGAVVAVIVVGLAILNYQALHRAPIVPQTPVVVTVTTEGSTP